ncbi:MAG: tetratricopeptide repeat protein [Pirellulaceae bacterium]
MLADRCRNLATIVVLLTAVFHGDAVEAANDSAQQALEKGRQFAQSGDILAAIEQFNTAIERQADFAPAFLERAKLHMFLNSQLAIADLDKAVELDPKSREALRWRALLVAQHQQDPTAARRDLDALIKLAPDDASAYLMRCLLRRSTGDALGASEDVDKAIELDGDFVEARKERASERLFQPGRQNFEEVLADLNHALEAAPHDPETLRMRGMAHDRSGDVDAAIDDYTAALALNPPRNLRLQLLNLRGILRVRRDVIGKLNVEAAKAALADLDEVLEAVPSEVTTLAERVTIHLALDNYEAATRDCVAVLRNDPTRSLPRSQEAGERIRGLLEKLGAAISAKPDDPAAYLSRAKVYGALRGVVDPQQALSRTMADLEKAIELQDDLAEAYAIRGALYLEQKKTEKAIADLDKALSLAPKDVAALRDRGFAHEQAGDFKQAVADYSAILDIEPESARAYRWRGLVHNRLKELDKALADLKQAIELEPDDPENYVARCAIHDDNDQLEPAVADIKRAIELEPNNAENYFLLGSMYADQGEHQPAIDSYTRSIALEPNSPLPYGGRAKSHEALGNKAASDADRAMATRLQSP